MSIVRFPGVRTAWVNVGLAVGAAIVLMISAGCSGTSKRQAADPTVEMQNAGIDSVDRAAAFERAWASTSDSPKDRAVLREAAKTLAWKVSTPMVVRTRIVTTLVNDTDPAGAADARTMARLMISRETSRAMVAFLCELVSTRGWVECGPELIRSYARPVREVPDLQRGERVALTMLFPDRKLEDLVFDLFLHPESGSRAGAGAGEGADLIAEKSGTSARVDARNWDELLRSDCWDLLARLDADGTYRAEILVGPVGASSSEPIVRDLRACVAELKAVPLTGDELKWVRSLHDASKAGNAGWWAEASSAIAGLRAEQAKGLQVRHAEPVRWAKAHRAAWLAMSRAELLSEISKRIEARDRYSRTGDDATNGIPVRQDLAFWAGSLRWGDLLTMLVLDDATRQPLMVAELFRHAEVDRRDTSTEMGGLIEPAAALKSGETGRSDDQFRARLFRPRSAERRGDEQFVASDDMVAAADRSTASYHFHAQNARNGEYAGPSVGDLQFAARSGRNCLVFTTVSRTRINVDYYQPDGVVVDLGSIDQASR